MYNETAQFSGGALSGYAGPVAAGPTSISDELGRLVDRLHAIRMNADSLKYRLTGEQEASIATGISGQSVPAPEPSVEALVGRAHNILHEIEAALQRAGKAVG